MAGKRTASSAGLKPAPKAKAAKRAAPKPKPKRAAPKPKPTAKRARQDSSSSCESVQAAPKRAAKKAKGTDANEALAALEPAAAAKHVTVLADTIALETPDDFKEPGADKSVLEKLHKCNKEVPGSFKLRTKISLTTMVHVLCKKLLTGDIISLGIAPEAIRSLRYFLNSVTRLLCATIIRAVNNLDKDDMKAYRNLLKASKISDTGESACKTFASLGKLYLFFVEHYDVLHKASQQKSSSAPWWFEARTNKEGIVTQIYVTQPILYTRVKKDYIGRFCNDSAAKEMVLDEGNDLSILKSITGLKKVFREALFCDYDYQTGTLTPFAMELDMSAAHQMIMKNIIRIYRAEIESFIKAGKNAAGLSVAEAKETLAKIGSKLTNLCNVLDKVTGPHKNDVREEIGSFYHASKRLRVRKALLEKYESVLSTVGSAPSVNNVLDAYMVEIGWGPETKDEYVPFGKDVAKQLMLAIMFGGSSEKFLTEEDARSVEGKDEKGKTLYDDKRRVHPDIHAIEHGLQNDVPDLLKLYEKLPNAKPYVSFAKCLERYKDRDGKEKKKEKEEKKSYFHQKAKKFRASAESSAMAVFLQSIEALVIYHVKEKLPKLGVGAPYLYLYDGLYVDTAKITAVKGAKPLKGEDWVIESCVNHVESVMGMTVGFETKSLSGALLNAKADYLNESTCLVSEVDNLSRIMFYIAFQHSKFSENTVSACAMFLAAMGLDITGGGLYVPKDQVISCAQFQSRSGFSQSATEDLKRLVAVRPVAEYTTKFYGKLLRSQYAQMIWSTINPAYLISMREVKLQDIMATVTYCGQTCNIMNLIRDVASFVEENTQLDTSFKSLELADSEIDVRNAKKAGSLFWKKFNTIDTSSPLGLPKSFLKVKPYTLHQEFFGVRGKKPSKNDDLQASNDIRIGNIERSNRDNVVVQLTIYQDPFIHSFYHTIHGVPLMDDNPLPDFVRSLPIPFHLLMLSDLNNLDASIETVLCILQCYSCRIRYPLAKVPKMIFHASEAKGCAKTMIPERLFGRDIYGFNLGQTFIRESMIRMLYKIDQHLFVSLSKKEIDDKFNGFMAGAALILLDEVGSALDPEKYSSILKTMINSMNQTVRKMYQETQQRSSNYMVYATGNLTHLGAWSEELERRLYLTQTSSDHTCFNSGWVSEVVKLKDTLDDTNRKLKYIQKTYYSPGTHSVAAHRSRTLGEMLIDDLDWAYSFYRNCFNMDREYSSPNTLVKQQENNSVNEDQKHNEAEYKCIVAFDVYNLTADMPEEFVKFWNLDMVEHALKTGSLTITAKSIMNLCARETTVHTLTATQKNAIENKIVYTLGKSTKLGPSNNYAFLFDEQFHVWKGDNRKNCWAYKVFSTERLGDGRAEDYSSAYVHLAQLYIRIVCFPWDNEECVGRAQIIEKLTTMKKRMLGFYAKTTEREYFKTSADLFEKAIEELEAKQQQPPQSLLSQQGIEVSTPEAAADNNNELADTETSIFDVENAISENKAKMLKVSEKFWNMVHEMAKRVVKTQLMTDGRTYKPVCTCGFTDEDFKKHEMTIGENPCYYARMQKDPYFDLQGFTFAERYPPDYETMCRVFGHYKLDEFKKELSSEKYFNTSISEAYDQEPAKYTED